MKKADLSIRLIIVFIILIVFLIVFTFIMSDKYNIFSKSVSCEDAGGECLESGCEFIWSTTYSCEKGKKCCLKPEVD